MIKINKGKEPATWRRKRETSGATYEATPELREALLKEQGYICAYCMRRIPLSKNEDGVTSKIEHIKNQSGYPQLSMSYDNMVICCPGFIKGEAHCDKSKADKELSFDLLDVQLENSISYSTHKGVIKSTNLQWDKEINEILNLNHTVLMLNRRSVIAVLTKRLGERTVWKRSVIEKELLKWQTKNEDGKYNEMCGVVIWFLKDKLRR